MKATMENARDTSSSAHAVAGGSAEGLVLIGEGCVSPPFSAEEIAEEIAAIEKKRRRAARKTKRRMAVIARELGPWPD